MVHLHERLLVLVSGLALSAASLIAASKSAPSAPTFYNECHRQCHYYAIGESQLCANLYPKSDPYLRSRFFKCLCNDFIGFDNAFESCVRLGQGLYGACKYPQDVFDREAQWCHQYS